MWKNDFQAVALRSQSKVGAVVTSASAVFGAKVRISVLFRCGWQLSMELHASSSPHESIYDLYNTMLYAVVVQLCEWIWENEPVEQNETFEFLSNESWHSGL